MIIHMHMRVKQNIIQSRIYGGGAYLSVGVSILTRAELQEPVRGGRGGLSSSPSVKQTHTHTIFEKAVLIFTVCVFISALAIAL